MIDVFVGTSKLSKKLFIESPERRYYKRSAPRYAKSYLMCMNHITQRALAAEKQASSEANIWSIPQWTPEACSEQRQDESAGHIPRCGASNST